MAIDKSKCNAELGKAVYDHFKKLGINTPTVPEALAVSDEDKIEIIADHMASVLTTLGLDLSDDSLQDTPRRVAKMFVKEIYSGLKPSAFPKCTTVENKFASKDEFVLEKDITLFSDCEHHLRTIYGKVHIAYVPKDKVLGLSKLNRVAQTLGAQPAVQERLTQQIAHAIQFITGAEDVMVMVEAKHMCVSQRGIKDTSSVTVTAAALGRFGETDSYLRREFNANVK